MVDRKLTITFLGDASKLNAEAKKAEKSVSSFEKATDNIGGKLAGAFSAGAVLAFTKSAIGAASDLAESQSKVKEIFGESADEIDRWSDKTSTAIGQSKQDAMDAASTFATFGKSAGLAGGDLSKFAEDLTGLSSDLASFYNTSPADAVEAIGAAMRGEAEPIRRYGVLMDEASLKQAALAAGIIHTTKGALTPQQKVLAAQALIFKQTSDAQGDFARTSDGLANSQRILAAQMKDAEARIGKALLPSMLQLTQAGVDLVPLFETLATQMANALAQAAPLAKAVGWLGKEMSKANAEGDDTGKSFADRLLGSLETFALGSSSTIVREAWRNIKAPFEQEPIDFTFRSTLTSFTDSASRRADEQAVRDYLSGKAMQAQAVDNLTEKQKLLHAVQMRGNAAQEEWNATAAQTKKDADAAAKALQRIDAAWQALTDSIDAEQAKMSLDEAFKDLPKTRGEVLALKEAVNSFGREVLKIPPTLATRLDVDLDQGKYEQVKRLLDALAQSQKVMFEPVTKVPKGGKQMAAGGWSSGGRTLVGEYGPELVDLPPGSIVTTASRTQSMMASGGGVAPVSVVVNVSGSVVTEGQLVDRIHEGLLAKQRRVPLGLTRT